MPWNVFVTDWMKNIVIILSVHVHAYVHINIYYIIKADKLPQLTNTIVLRTCTVHALYECIYTDIYLDMYTCTMFYACTYSVSNNN